jgi:hypothetical protein
VAAKGERDRGGSEAACLAPPLGPRARGAPHLLRAARAAGTGAAAAARRGVGGEADQVIQREDRGLAGGGGWGGVGERPEDGGPGSLGWGTGGERPSFGVRRSGERQARGRKGAGPLADLNRTSLHHPAPTCIQRRDLDVGLAALSSSSYRRRSSHSRAAAAAAPGPSPSDTAASRPGPSEASHSEQICDCSAASAGPARSSALHLFRSSGGAAKRGAGRRRRSRPGDAAWAPSTPAHSRCLPTGRHATPRHRPPDAAAGEGVFRLELLAAGGERRRHHLAEVGDRDLRPLRQRLGRAQHLSGFCFESGGRGRAGGMGGDAVNASSGSRR